ncbi:MAG: HlyD family efflux transporter periplasmic adaptor subunit [Chitinispirillaceae bacterium]|nr:HlyD family efflux transporter periplasmic adaptor subunit [Chitinispirillaceae bacterium]
MEKRRKAAIIPVIVAFLADAFFLRCGERRVTSDWAVVFPQEAVTKVLAEGKVVRGRTVPFALMKSGIIDEVRVEEGARVLSGDTLMIIDNEEETNVVAQRSVDVAIARINLDKLKSIEYRQAQERLSQAKILEELAAKQRVRGDTLFLQGSIMQSELDELKKEHELRHSQRLIAETEVASVTTSELQLRQSRLTKAQLLLQEATIALSRTILVAPADGKVAALLRAKGEFTAAGGPLLHFQPSDTVLAVEMRLEEGTAATICSGQRAHIVTAGGAPRTIEAVVKKKAGRAEGRRDSFTVILGDISSPDIVLRTGQTVSVQIVTRRIPDAIVIDKRFHASLHDGDYVYLKKGDRAHQCPVLLADIGDGRSIVRKGLAAGDTVLAAKALSDRAIVALAEKKRIRGPVPTER